jgi:hypothetical protein
MMCRAYAGVTLWLLGYPEEAVQRSREALILAQELKHSYSLATALAFAAWVHHFRREGQLTQERADAGIALSTERGFKVLVAQGTILRGWAMVSALSQALQTAGAAPGQARRRPARCWRPFTAGSPRGLTPSTCRRRKRCWQSWEGKDREQQL